MEWAHMLLLLVLSQVYSYADAQGNYPISNPPVGVSIRDNLKATMGVMLVSFLSAFLFMGFFSFYLRHCSRTYHDNASPIVAAVCAGGFNRQLIDKCPVLAYSSVKDLKIGKGAVECAVCLSEFEDCDNIRLLPKCHHVFHPDCIDVWLPSHMNCPVCRASVTSDHTSLDDIAVTVPTLCVTNSTEPEPNREQPQPQPQPQPREEEEEARESNMEEGESSSRSVAREPDTENDASDLAETVIPARESRVLDKFPRSFSMGHNLVGPEEVEDRYTLRLPEHVRKKIIMNHRRIQRLASSDVVLPGAWSSKRVCYRSSTDERWSLSLTPPLVSNGYGGFTGMAREEKTCSWTPLRMSFDGAHGGKKPSHILPV